MGDSGAPDWTVFAAALGIGLVSALALSVIPIAALWRGDFGSVLVRGRTGGAGGRGGRLEGGLVVADVALAVAVTAGAALLMRSVAELRSIDPGVDVDGIAVLHVATAGGLEPAARRGVVADMVSAAGAVPGVRRASSTDRLPLAGAGGSEGIVLKDRADDTGASTYYRIVGRDYFEVMGIDVLRGRGFDLTDRAGGEPVVVVNQALVDRWFPDQDPVGRRINHGLGGDWATIVGVVGNVAEGSLTEIDPPARYVLHDQVAFTPTPYRTVVLRMERGDAAAVLDDARGALAREAPAVGVRSVTTMDRVFAEALGPARQVLVLLGILAALALVLGAVGVYGVVSHFVAGQRRDTAIRFALGLPPRRAMAEVLWHGGVLVTGGAALGVGLAWALARLLAGFLYGVPATDPVSLTGAALVLLLLGLLTALIPALRAGRIDPATTLREQ